MLGRGLILIGGALGGAGVYGFLLYDFSWQSAVMCIFGATIFIGAGYISGAGIASAPDASKSHK